MVKFWKKGDKVYVLDVTGYTCPYPVIYMKNALGRIGPGETLEVIFDNPPSCETLPEAATEDGHEVVSLDKIGSGLWRLIVRRR